MRSNHDADSAGGHSREPRLQVAPFPVSQQVERSLRNATAATSQVNPAFRLGRSFWKQLHERHFDAQNL